MNLKNKSDTKKGQQSQKKSKHRRVISDVGAKKILKDSCEGKGHEKKEKKLQRKSSLCKTPITQKKDRTHRRTVSDVATLAPLNGKNYQKAPKIYKNQIFRDIYDEHGNHDRVMDTVSSIEVYEEVNIGNVITFNNKSDISTQKFIQPDLSYKSVEYTSNNFKQELYEKLLGVSKKCVEIDCLMKPITIERHQFGRIPYFQFHEER
jgi:hypothetical protein